jgi:SSS family transporter
MLHAVDYAMLVGYFLLMLAIGVYFYRYMKGMRDYFTGGNNIPWWLSGVSFYMSSFSVYAFIAYPALCYKYGMVGVTLLWVAVPATLFSVLLFAKRWRRARIDSPVEYLETRYSPLLRQLFAWQGVPVKMVDDGLKLVSIGTFISVGLGFPMSQSMIGAGLIMLIYTMMGGLWAVAVTDFVQFVVLTVAILIVLPLSLSHAGGWEKVWNESPPGFFNLTNDEFGWIYVALLALLYSLAWSSINWSLIQRYYCVRDEKEAVKAGWLVTVLYIIGPPLMFLPAMAAVHFLGEVPDKEVYPRLCVELLPAGMLGLVIAAMFSATMSMLSSDYNVCASVLTNDVYKRYVRPFASDRELVTVGRIMTLIIGLIALGVAFLISEGSGEDMFKIMVTLFGIATAPVAVPMLLGLVTRKVNNLGAVLGFAIGLAVGLGLFFLFPSGVKKEILGVVWDGEKGNLLVAGWTWSMEIFLFMSTALTTLIVVVIVSALKPAPEEERERAEEFLRLLETPIGQLEKDRALMEGQVGFSPFGVVGLSIAAIGLLMLGTLPWLLGTEAFSLDLFLGLLLIVIGAVLWWRSRRI